MSKPLAFHHFGVMGGKDVYVESNVNIPPDVSVFTGWSKEDGFRIDPHVCNQFCIHEPTLFGVQEFSTRGLPFKKFSRLVDALIKIRNGIDAGNLQFFRLQRSESGGLRCVEVDPRALEGASTEEGES